MEVRTPRRFTVDEYLRMVEAGIIASTDRVELLDGVVVAMAGCGPTHASVVNRLTDRLVRLLPGRAIVHVQNPVRLDDHSLPEPDLALLRWRDDFYRDAYPRPDDVLLLIEVCDSSGRTDRRDKLPRYARAQIAEVWLVDIVARRVEMHRDPRGGRYEVVTIAGPSDVLTPAAFADVTVEVAPLVG